MGKTKIEMAFNDEYIETPKEEKLGAHAGNHAKVRFSIII